MGSLGAGPMLAFLFSSGMKQGGPWLGLPYFSLPAGWCAELYTFALD